MIAYKFLRTGGEGPFTGFAWPLPDGDDPGDWVEGDCLRGACAAGVHACRPGDLPVWLNDELWLAELDGAVTEARSKVVAPRGRLLRQVDAWNRETASVMAQACARRARHHAAMVLRSSGLRTSAETLQAFSLAEMAGAHELLPFDAGVRVTSAVGYASDAAGVALAGGGAAPVAYMAVRAAINAADSPTGGVRERHWQARWLRDRLSLA